MLIEAAFGKTQTSVRVIGVLLLLLLLLQVKPLFGSLRIARPRAALVDDHYGTDYGNE